jgi:transcriptional regulator with XRE-family HTH domain
MYKATAKLLKEARTRAGISQLDLALKLGLTSSQYISNIERGLNGISRESAKKAAKILGVPFDDFVEAAAEDYKTRYKLGDKDRSTAADL